MEFPVPTPQQLWARLQQLTPSRTVATALAMGVAALDFGLSLQPGVGGGELPLPHLFNGLLLIAWALAVAHGAFWEEPALIFAGAAAYAVACLAVPFHPSRLHALLGIPALAATVTLALATPAPPPPPRGVKPGSR